MPGVPDAEGGVYFGPFDLDGLDQIETPGMIHRYSPGVTWDGHSYWKCACGSAGHGKPGNVGKIYGLWLNHAMRFLPKPRKYWVRVNNTLIYKGDPFQ